VSWYGTAALVKSAKKEFPASLAVVPVLLPTGLRFSTSADRPDWTAEAEKALRSFHSRYAGSKGEPPLQAHLAATSKHRERLTKGVDLGFELRDLPVELRQFLLAGGFNAC
jgi:hypothetical protein